jgi:hypothetical protein
LVIGAPLLVQFSLERILIELLEMVKDRPQFTSGLALFSLFFPLWRAIGFIAGITLLVSTPSIYKGEEWTWPVALVAFSIPAVGGMFMFLPYISWVDGFPVPMVISWVGLLGFWSIIFLRHTGRIEKWALFFSLTFIGMLATHAFTIGVGAQRMLLTRPDRPLFAGLEMWILTWVGEVNWICFVMLMISIPLLAMRKRSGWYLALIGAIAILVIDAPTQIIRTKTLDYLYGSLLAIGVLFFINLPVFKQALIGERRFDRGEEAAIEEKAGVEKVAPAT